MIIVLQENLQKGKIQFNVCSRIKQIEKKTLQL
jgi:hypothetical protein